MTVDPGDVKRTASGQERRGTKNRKRGWGVKVSCHFVKKRARCEIHWLSSRTTTTESKMQRIVVLPEHRTAVSKRKGGTHRAQPVAPSLPWQLPRLSGLSPGRRPGSCVVAYGLDSCEEGKPTMKGWGRGFFQVPVALGRPCPLWLHWLIPLWRTLPIREKPELCVNSLFSARLRADVTRRPLFFQELYGEQYEMVVESWAWQTCSHPHAPSHEPRDLELSDLWVPHFQDGNKSNKRCCCSLLWFIWFSWVSP